MPFRERIYLIKTWIKGCHVTECLRSPECGTNKTLIGNAIGHWSKELQGLSRSRIRVPEEVLTGHNNLNKHRHTTGRTFSPEYERCQKRWEDSQHILKSQLHVNLTPHQVYFSTLVQSKFHTDVIRKLQIDIKNILQFLSWAGIQLQVIYVKKVDELVSTLIPSDAMLLGRVVQFPT